MERPAGSPAVARDWWWVFDPRESLRARAVLVLGGGAVLFTLAMASLGGALFRRHLERQLGASFESVATQVSNTIDRRLYERYRELLFTASLAPLRDRGSDPVDRRRVLEALQQAAPDFAWIGFIDPAGHIVAATRRHFEGESARERPWFTGALESPYAATLRDMPALTDRLTDRDADPRVLDFAVPVTGLDGEFAGVLASHLRWGWSRDVQRSILPDTARRELLGVTLYDANGKVLLDSGASGWSEPPDAPTLPPRKFRGSTVETTAEGSVYLTGFLRSRGHAEFRGLGWLTTVRQPVTRALAPARELQLAIARWGLLFSGVLIVASWIFAGRLARRMDAVSTAAARIRSGDILTVMPQPRGQAEIDRMCGAVGELVEDLRPRDEPRDPSAPPPPVPPKGNYVRPTGSDPRRVIW